MCNAPAYVWPNMPALRAGAELFMLILGSGLSSRLAPKAWSKLPLGYLLVAEKPA